MAGVHRDQRILKIESLFELQSGCRNGKRMLPMAAFAYVLHELYTPHEILMISKPTKKIVYARFSEVCFEYLRDLVISLDCYLTWVKHMIIVTRKQKGMQLQIKYLLKTRGDSSKAISVNECRTLVNSLFGDQTFSKLEPLLENPIFVIDGEFTMQSLVALTCILDSDLHNVIPQQEDVENTFFEIVEDLKKLHTVEPDFWADCIEIYFEKLCVYSENVFPIYNSCNVAPLIKQCQRVNGFQHNPDISIKYTDLIKSKRSTYSNNACNLLSLRNFNEVSVSSATSNKSSKSSAEPVSSVFQQHPLEIVWDLCSSVTLLDAEIDYTATAKFCEPDTSFRPRPNKRGTSHTSTKSKYD